MTKEKLILEFSDDNMREELFSFADIPEKWFKEDFIVELDHYEILDALEDVASHVSDDEFEGGPGMSGHYYKVYAYDLNSFKKALTKKLMELLSKYYG